jgi:hypothetical protein
VPTALGATPGTELWAVVYDIDDNQQVDFGDLSFFAAAFGHTVGEPNMEPPHVWWADFDKSGRVDFGDWAFFAPNFGKTRAAVQACTQTLVFPGNFPDAWNAGSGAGAGEGQALGGEGEAASSNAMGTPSAADDSASGELGLQREPAAVGRALWIVATQHQLPTGEFTAGDTRWTLTGTGRVPLLPAGAPREESSVTLYSRSGSPVAKRVERTYRWPDRWESLEDILSLLAKQTRTQSLDDALDPHDTLFARFGREEIR